MVESPIDRPIKMHRQETARLCQLLQASTIRSSGLNESGLARKAPIANLPIRYGAEGMHGRQACRLLRQRRQDFQTVHSAAVQPEAARFDCPGSGCVDSEPGEILIANSQENDLGCTQFSIGTQSATHGTKTEGSIGFLIIAAENAQDRDPGIMPST